MPFLFDWTTFSSPNGTTTINDGANSTTFTSTGFSSSGANNPGYYTNFGGTIFSVGVGAGEESGVNMTFSTAVDNLSFAIVDLDQGPGWDDQVQILAYDVDGNLLTPTFTFDPTVHTQINATTIEADGNNSTNIDGPTAPDSVTVTFDSPVATIQIITSGSDSSGVSSAVIGISDFTGDVVCFAHDTLIETDRGQVPVQDLRPSDLVQTMDNGLQPIRWVGSRRVAAVGKFAPIHIAKEVLGNSTPLVLSPQHRVLVRGWQAELQFAEPEVLVAAKHLINDTTITRREGGEVIYYHILCDQHEVVYANGAPCESFHPGQVGLDGMGAEQHAEIIALFPELEHDAAGFGPSARMTLKSSEAKVLV
ncbi:Hint domain-containing protein [Yoonia sp. I 8.24]|uniref:Hint domain-containing protein n=1 Tax=Yoonia sp. I 8.24 TaxID=1537229 RepID=UPI001EE045AF|nr:Hint domain-containing protein [Yoonia sp. I 8.24]MCG3268802.1 Hint domain-containing protein [Yoonia sp. I 8.24]